MSTPAPIAARPIYQARSQPDADSEQTRNATNERTITLSKANTLTGYKLDSLGGEIGKVKEFYFDDRHWTIRYLVADAGNRLTGRQVLISPYARGPSPYLVRDREKWKTPTQGKKAWVPHLRSTCGVSGHHTQALDGEIGLHRHYNRKGYWVGEPAAKEHAC